MFIRLGSRLPSASNLSPEDQGVWNANRVDGVPVDTTGIAARQVLVFDGTDLVAGYAILADGSVALAGNWSLGTNTLSNCGGLSGTGDLDMGGGYRNQFDGWYADNVGAGAGPTQMSRFANGADVDKVFLPRAGSITGVWVHSDMARVGGTLTVEVYKNGVGTGLTAVLDGTNTTFKATTQAKDLDTFAAGDELDIRFTTDGAWDPIAADIRAGFEVET